MGKGQIAIEFMTLTAIAFVILFTVLVASVSLSKSKTDERTYFELRDFGAGIQRELILATELEDGYHRRINLPVTVNGRDYSVITNGSATNETGFFVIEYKGRELYYAIPSVEGEFRKGDNVIVKKNDTIRIEN